MVIEPAIPSDDGAGRADVWLRFTTRFVRGLEATVEDPCSFAAIGLITVGPVGSKNCAHFVDVVLNWRLAVEVPSSKLDTHVYLLHCQLTNKTTPSTTASLIKACMANSGGYSVKAHGS